MTEADALALLTSLGIPPGGALDAAIAPGADAARHLDRLLTDGALDRLWQDWKLGPGEAPGGGPARDALRSMLGEGLSMGLGVGRFRELARDVAASPAARDTWVSAFEAIVVTGLASSIRIRLGARRYRLFVESNAGGADNDERWDQMLQMMRDGLFYELGVVYPRFDIEADDLLGETELRVEWNDAKLPPQPGIRDGQVLVNDTPDRLALLDIAAEPALNPANGRAAALVAHTQAGACKDASLTTWTPMGHAVLSISAQLRHAAKACVHRHLIDYYLQSLASAQPQLVASARERIDANVLAACARALVDEGITIRDFERLIETLSMPMAKTRADLGKCIVFAHSACLPLHEQAPAGAPAAVEHGIARLRVAMSRYLSHKVTRGRNTLSCHLLEASTEARLRQPAALSATERVALVDGVRDGLGATWDAVILTGGDVRRCLRTLLRHDFADVTVLSYEELDPSMNISPLARIDGGLQAYDESLLRLVSALPGATAAPPRDGTAVPRSDDALATRLRAERDAIVRRVHAGLDKRGLLPPGAPQASTVLERHVDALLAQLVDRDALPLRQLVSELSPGLALDGVRWSSLLQIPFEVREAVRRCLTAAVRGGDLEPMLERLDRDYRDALGLTLGAIVAQGLGGHGP